MEKFNQKEYINDWKKKNKKQFKAELNPDEMEELNTLLKQYGLNKSQFIRYGKECLIKFGYKKEPGN